MFIRYILKNMRRSAVTNALFCLLLALAGALLTLSAGLWYSVYQTERNLDEMITTIALPDMFAIRRYVRNQVNNGDLSMFTNEEGVPLDKLRADFYDAEQYKAYVSEQIYKDVMNRISEDVYDSGVVQMDDRRVYGAYAPGISSVTYHITEYLISEDFVQSAPQSVAAFVVNCVGVEQVFNLEWIQEKPVLYRSLVADFRVEQDVYLHHGRFRTQTVTGFLPFRGPDGAFPVEEGKRYVVMGYEYNQSGYTTIVNPTHSPSWYNSLPLNKNIPNGLYIDIIGANYDFVETEVAYSISDINDNIRPIMRRLGIKDEDFPISIIDRIPRTDPALGFEGYACFEITGSLDEALNSELGEQIEAALSVAKISQNSLTVLTTNDVNSLLRFNQRSNRLADGRAINDTDVKNGSRVCMIHEQLAELNGLSVGDRISLQMYLTTLGRIPIRGDLAAWMPNPYHPLLTLSESVDFEIVGVFSGLIQEMADNAISANTVIIPAVSYGGFEGTPISRTEVIDNPPLLHTIIVENERIEETKALIDSIAEGYSSFFRFFDQGYSTLKPVLNNFRFSMTWILAIAAAGWVIAVAIFSMFYIGRKKTDVALLSCLGVSRRKGFLWAFIQSSTVIIAAQCLVTAVSTSFFRYILVTAVSATRSFTEIYRDFTLSDMNIAGGVRLALPLETSLVGVIMATLCITALLLLVAWFFSARAAKPRFGKQGES